MKFADRTARPRTRALHRVNMIYDCCEFKSMPLEPRPLPELGEGRGELLRVHELDGFCIAIFSWGGISLPGEFAARLRGLVGRKVGILHLDGYHIRDLDGEGHG